MIYIKNNNPTIKKVFNIFMWIYTAWPNTYRNWWYFLMGFSLSNVKCVLEVITLTLTIRLRHLDLDTYTHCTHHISNIIPFIIHNLKQKLTFNGKKVGYMSKSDLDTKRNEIKKLCHSTSFGTNICQQVPPWNKITIFSSTNVNFLSVSDD